MERYDVAVLGGGLAGLTLAMQLKRERPDTSILVLEKRKGPAPLAAFKVGESTVEVSGHYLAYVCGLRDHLEADQITKPGLRFWMPSDDNADITQRVEWGAAGVPPELRIKSYQVDRGVLENHLADRCRELGVDLREGSRVGQIEVNAADADHSVSYARDDAEHTASARWLVDAAGRAAILKRELGIEKETEHTINSSWFRLEGDCKVDDWSDDAAWQDRMIDRGTRWQATNHLMGTGYWVWLIPLSSGATSIGICADPRFHPYEQIKTRDAALEWLDEHEPELAGKVRDRLDDMQDFLTVADYSHGTQRMYSSDRWALTGEAGPFADPFYSPGSDYIALGNGCIADLVQRDLAGEPIDERAEAFNSMLLEAFDQTMTIYTGQYELWGNPQVMTVKIIWDYAVYWGLTALRSIQGVWHDLDFYERNRELILRGYALNERMQPFLREWHRLGVRPASHAFVSPLAFPGLLLQRIHIEQVMDAGEVEAALSSCVELLEGVAVRVFFKALEQAGHTLSEGARVDPWAMSLEPDRWEPDGVFDGSGLTLEEARGRTEGMNVWLDELEPA